MSQQMHDQEAVARAFARAMALFADSRGIPIPLLMAAIPHGMWEDICDRLNVEGVHCPDEQPWNPEKAASYWNKNSDGLAALCRGVVTGKPASPAAERILELWGEGIPILAILAILTQEGFTDEAGQQFTPESIADTIDTHEKDQLPFLHEQQAGNLLIDADRHLLGTSSETCFSGVAGMLACSQADIPETSTGHEPCVTHEQMQTALNHLRKTFRDELEVLSVSMRRHMAEVLADVTKTPKQEQEHDLPELPPAAPLRGLKKLGSRVKVAGTMDAELLDRLESERKVRNISLSAMIDTIAWHYFGKPKLSFERVSEDEPPALARRHKA